MNLNQITNNIILKIQNIKEDFLQRISNAGQRLKAIKLPHLSKNSCNEFIEVWRQKLYQTIQDKRNILIFTGSILLCELVGITGIFIGKLAVNDVSLFWYEYLFKPAFTPSGLIYEGVWLFLCLLTGISLYLILNSEKINQEAIQHKLKKVFINPEPCQKEGNKKHALIILGIQFILSILLIPVFFGLKSTLGGLVISILIWLSIFLMLYKFYKIIIPASLLMIPSVLWSAYLVGLNFTFWLLNDTQWIMWSFKHKLF